MYCSLLSNSAESKGVVIIYKVKVYHTKLKFVNNSQIKTYQKILYESKSSEESDSFGLVTSSSVILGELLSAL